MKKFLLFLIAMSLFSTLLAQENKKTVNTKIESVRVGDTIYYKKTTTTINGNDIKVEEEILSSKDINNNNKAFTSFEESHLLGKNNDISFLIGFGATVSFLNENGKLNRLLSMDGINQVNGGVDFEIGVRSKINLEIIYNFGIESTINKSNNKTLSSQSSYCALDFGYPVNIVKDKFEVVPNIGFGFNSTQMQYSAVSDKDITYEELMKNTWSLSSNSFYIPVRLDLRFKIRRTSYITLGAEYRLNLYSDKPYLPFTNQQVIDFPKFRINDVAIKFGILRMF